MTLQQEEARRDAGLPDAKYPHLESSGRPSQEQTNSDRRSEILSEIEETGGLDTPPSNEDIQLADVLRHQRAEFLQLKDETDHSGEFFTAAQIGSMSLDLGTEYNRKLPDNFSEDSPNKFMYLILTNFALEGKEADGKPNGKFTMNKDLT